MTGNIAKDAWRGRALPIRQRYMAQDLVVPHPALANIMNEIQRLSLRTRNEEKGLAFLVLGGSGSGKTFLTRCVKKRWPSDHSGEVSKVPVVSFSIPPAPTQRSMASELLRSLGDAKWKSGSAQELLDRALHQLRQVETLILFIDNVHDIPERRRTGGVLHLGNWIRDLIDRSGCLVVLLGTPAAKVVTEANAQLRRRVAREFSLPYFNLGARQAKARYLRFLELLDEALPLADKSGLANASLAERIYWATYGIQDYIFQLVTEAVGYAVSEQRETLSEKPLLN